MFTTCLRPSIPIDILFLFSCLSFIIHSPCHISAHIVKTFDCTTSDENPWLNQNVSSRNGLTDPNRLWRNNFDVLLDWKFGKTELGIIKKAIGNIGHVLPCLRFRIYSQYTSLSGDYINIVRGSSNTGCNADIGRKGGRQTINLEAPGCITLDTVMHEILHALGLYHEQARYDRDEYINIIWDNIRPEKIHNFQVKSNSHTNTFGVPYNIYSLMHYKSKSFSKNFQPTILGKNGEKVGSRGILQPTDIKKLQRMYSC